MEQLFPQPPDQTGTNDNSERERCDREFQQERGDVVVAQGNGLVIKKQGLRPRYRQGV